jgi:predicted  nucleic acid-binding Zn-ribbon protein
MTPDELRLQAQLDDLRKQLADAHDRAENLQAELDDEQSRLIALLPDASPEEEEEFRRLIGQVGGDDGRAEIARIVAELEAAGGE